MPLAKTAGHHPASLGIRVLCVGGGGGGGQMAPSLSDGGAGGGGGGGGFNQIDYVPLALTAYQVTVGAGGGPSLNGANSMFVAPGSALVAIGYGGGGGGGSAHGNGNNSANGGGGGGAANAAGGSGIQNGFGGGSTNGGGGGGIQGAPSFYTGGNGVLFDAGIWTPDAFVVCPGGGGGRNLNPIGGSGGNSLGLGAGGAGAGGTGTDAILGNAFGAGGGGGSSPGNNLLYQASVGAQGIVMISYDGTIARATGGVITIVSGRTIHTFNANGTFTTI